MKKILSLIAALSVILSLTLKAAAAGAAPETACASSILMERETGTVLCEVNSHEHLSPASVTKIMTLLLITEAVDSGRLSLDDTVTASTNASKMGGSQIYLKENEQMSLEDMLKSVVVASANDCAVALAEHLCGSESAFVERMNERAAELGMNDTHFSNCTGLTTENHYTCAYDIALMSRELLSHEMIKNYTTIWMDTVRDGQFGLSNTNKLIRYYDGATGLKTGFTSEAMYCLSASAERDGMELIAVILKAPTSADRFESAKALLSYGFSNYALTELPAQDYSVDVKLGRESSVSLVPDFSGKLLLEKGEAANIETEVTLRDDVSAPVCEGDKLGEMRVTAEGEEIALIPLLASRDVERLGVGDILRRMLGCLI